MKGKIFNAQEVQAILNGCKVMFREVIKTCKQHPKSLCTKTRRAHYSIDFTMNGLFWRPYGGSELQLFPYVYGKLSNNVSLDDYCPYQVGQKIFVKERFFEEIHPDSLRKNGKIHYDASCDYEVIKVDGDGFQIFYKDGTPASPWKSPVHMKQEHSRITLEITEIKVEKLKEIYPKDVYKEGLPNHRLGQTFMWFEEHWNATHKKPEEKFEVNPFVWVVDFKINK